MIRRVLLAVALYVLCASLLHAAGGHGPGQVLGLAASWIVGLWVIWRAWPACCADVRRLLGRLPVPRLPRVGVRRQTGGY